METLGPVTFPATIPTVETDRLTLRACAPARLRACAPAHLLACLPAYLPACLPAYLPACLLACLPACLPARSRRGWRGSGGSHLICIRLTLRGRAQGAIDRYWASFYGG